MGTPHTGSWMAEWANIPASALGIIKSTNTSLLKILATNDQLFESLQIRFLSMLRDLRESNRRLEVTCFFEQLSSPVIGKVVPKESATLSGYNIISIHANHRDMVRFSSADNTGFTRVLGELIRWEAEIRMAPPLQATLMNSTSKESGRQNTSTHRLRRIYAGQSSSIHSPNSETNINEAVKQAIDEASATIISKDDKLLRVSLLDLPHDKRAQVAASECIEALGLGEQVK